MEHGTEALPAYDSDYRRRQRLRISYVQVVRGRPFQARPFDFGRP